MVGHQKTKETLTKVTKEEEEEEEDEEVSDDKTGKAVVKSI